jgi:hypothetical protein
MENKIYNILWIDDEYDKLGALIRSAKDFGIHLIPYKSLDGGMSELEKNYPFYDGVLLDAKFFENEDDAAGSEDTYSSFRAKERIERLPKKFEIFILTGQAEAFDDKTFNKVFANIYRKGIDKDEDDLFESLIKAADNQIDTQIRHENPKIFKALETYELEASKTLLKILTSIKIGSNDFDDKEQFTQIRIILEMMFRKANAIGLLHDNCIPRGQVNLTDSSLFLAGEDTNHSRVRCTKTHFPKIIADAVKNILFVTGGASHTTEIDPTENINIQEHRNLISTPYLLYSLTFQLMDVLVWFDLYSANNSDVLTNKSFWENISYDNNRQKWENGKLVRIAPNGWGTVETDKGKKAVSVYSDLHTNLRLSEGDNVKVIVEYSNKAKKIEKL